MLRVGAAEDRDFVPKAANRALRQTGKRNQKLDHAAIREAQEIPRKAARYIAAGLLREPHSEAVERSLRESPPASCGKCRSMPNQPEKIAVRRARLSDAAAIAELSGQLGYPATEKDMALRLARLLRQRRSSAVLVAWAGKGKIAGWLHVSITPLLEVPLRAEVNGLIVAEGQRSSGCGSKLLQAAERWAKSKGCAGMSVRSNVLRGRAHAFYLRNGYEHYKTQKAFRKVL